MSESGEDIQVPFEPPMAFQAFAATLRPQAIRDDKGRAIGVTAGQPDEIWLKWLKRIHGNEKHTQAGWSALIDDYRKRVV